MAKLIHGKSRSDFKHNIKVMERAGYDSRRAVGASFGEMYNAIDRDERERAKYRHSKR